MTEDKQDPITAPDLSDEELIRIGDETRARKRRESVDKFLAGIVVLEKEFLVGLVPVPDLPRQQAGTGRVVVTATFLTATYDTPEKFAEAGPTPIAQGLVERMAAWEERGDNGE